MPCGWDCFDIWLPDNGNPGTAGGWFEHFLAGAGPHQSADRGRSGNRVFDACSEIGHRIGHYVE